MSQLQCGLAYSRLVVISGYLICTILSCSCWIRVSANCKKDRIVKWHSVQPHPCFVQSQTPRVLLAVHSWEYHLVGDPSHGVQASLYRVILSCIGNSISKSINCNKFNCGELMHSLFICKMPFIHIHWELCMFLAGHAKFDTNFHDFDKLEHVGIVWLW